MCNIPRKEGDWHNAWNFFARGQDLLGQLKGAQLADGAPSVVKPPVHSRVQS
jgi:hypothetical protein